MKKVSINTLIRDGKFVKNLNLIKNTVRGFEGKEVELTIKRKYKQRSLNQNAFYWGIIVPFFQQLLLEAWGEHYTSEQVHDILKSQCNFTEKYSAKTGEVIKIPLSTANLSSMQWMDYQERLRQFARDFFNASLPTPNEQLEFNF